MKKTFTLLAILFVFQVNSQTVTTLAGNATGGTIDGLFNVALFNGPNGIAMDSKGKLYVADAVSHRIRKIDLSLGTVTTIAGSSAGYQDGPALSAKFNQPLNLTLDNARSVYIADYLNYKIRKLDTLGNVTTFAGTTLGYLDGPSASAKFSFPDAVAFWNNQVYVTEFTGHKIRAISSGSVTTLTGSTAGFLDGNVSVAQFSSPYGITVDNGGNIIVCDRGNHKIRKIDTFGNVTTIAGSTAGFLDGSSSTAQFNTPTGAIVDVANNIYVADMNNHKIRKIDPLGNVTTIAGTTQGFLDGVGSAAQFNLPTSIVMDQTNNYIYIADFNNNRIRKIFLNRTDLGVNPLSSFNNFSVYPNPATNTLFLNSSDKIDKIEITNALGALVYTDKNLSTGLNEIDIKNITEGVYFAKVSNETGSRIIKFVKVN